MTNKVNTRRLNTRRLRRANAKGNIIAFNYRAAASEAGEVNQHVVAKMEPNSLRESENGETYFTARNINRVTGEDGGFRTYRADRIRGTVEIV